MPTSVSEEFFGEALGEESAQKREVAFHEGENLKNLLFRRADGEEIRLVHLVAEISPLTVSPVKIGV